MQKYLETGKIINKRGLKGELKIMPYCDSPQVLCSLENVYLDKDGTEKKKVLSAKVYKEFVYLILEGVSGPEDADRMRGKVLYADRDDIDIPEGRDFVADLIGLDVIDVDSGEKYGVITDIFNAGATDIIEISDGRNIYLMPNVDEMVIETDLQRGMFVRPIKGIFDNTKED